MPEAVTVAVEQPTDTQRLAEYGIVQVSQTAYRQEWLRQHPSADNRLVVDQWFTYDLRPQERGRLRDLQSRLRCAQTRMGRTLGMLNVSFQSERARIRLMRERLGCFAELMLRVRGQSTRLTTGTEVAIKVRGLYGGVFYGKVERAGVKLKEITYVELDVLDLCLSDLNKCFPALAKADKVYVYLPTGGDDCNLGTLIGTDLYLRIISGAVETLVQKSTRRLPWGGFGEYTSMSQGDLNGDTVVTTIFPVGQTEVAVQASSPRKFGDMGQYPLSTKLGGVVIDAIPDRYSDSYFSPFVWLSDIKLERLICPQANIEELLRGILEGCPVANLWVDNPVCCLG